MKIFLTTIALLIISISFSQNIEFKQENFDTLEDYNKAKTALEKGDEYFFSGEFKKALSPLKKAYTLNPNNALLNFKIGVCYFKINDLLQALPYFKNAQELDPKVDPKVSFALAQAYQANKKYQKAFESYSLYLASLSVKEKTAENNKVQKELDICRAKLHKNGSIEEDNKDREIAKNNAIQSTATNTQIAKKISTAKVTFKIQILSSSKPESVNNIKKVYTGSMKVKEIKVGDSYKYYVGNYTTREEVLKAIPKTKVEGAFPVRFKNGKRL